VLFVAQYKINVNAFLYQKSFWLTIQKACFFACLCYYKSMDNGAKQMQLLQKEIVRTLQGVIENAMDESDIYVDVESGLIVVQHPTSLACFMTIAFSFGESSASFEVKTARLGKADRPIEQLVIKTTIDFSNNQAFAVFYKTVGAELRDGDLYDMGNPYYA